MAKLNFLECTWKVATLILCRREGLSSYSWLAPCLGALWVLLANTCSLFPLIVDNSIHISLSFEVTNSWELGSYDSAEGICVYVCV